MCCDGASHNKTAGKGYPAESSDAGSLSESTTGSVRGERKCQGSSGGRSGASYHQHEHCHDAKSHRGSDDESSARGFPGVTTDRSFPGETTEQDSHDETSGATQAEQTRAKCHPHAVNASGTPTAAVRGGQSETTGDRRALMAAVPREAAQSAPESFDDDCSGTDTLANDHGTNDPGSVDPATTQTVASFGMPDGRRPVARHQMDFLERSRSVVPLALHPRH